MKEEPVVKSGSRERKIEKMSMWKSESQNSLQGSWYVTKEFIKIAFAAGNVDR